MTEENKKKKESSEGPGNDPASSYALTETIMGTGYDAVIEGRRFVIDFSRSYDGKRVSRFASVCKIVNTPAGPNYAPQSPEVYELDNLTPLQVHELGIAQVISFTPEQSERYKKWRVNRFKK